MNPGHKKIIRIVNPHMNLFCASIRPQLQNNGQASIRKVLLGALLSIFCADDPARAVEAPAYYAGKNITMLISTSPGGATDVAGRLVMRPG